VVKELGEGDIDQNDEEARATFGVGIRTRPMVKAGLGLPAGTCDLAVLPLVER
jgi:hypothetical protein